MPVRIAMLIRFATALFWCCLVSGCLQVRQTTKQPLGADGELFLYAEPFPQEAGRLRFAIRELFAIREDGGSVPLPVDSDEFSSTGNTRQRLVAHGILPPGVYTGIAIRVKQASLTGEEGVSQLLVPDRPHENRVLFMVKSGKATVLTMGLNYRQALSDPVTLTPAFHLQSATPPLLELTGYVTNRSSNTITVFDRRAATVGGIIETGRGPAGIAIDPRRRMAYVAFSGEDTIGILDMKENDFIERIRLNPGDEPHFLAITPDGRLAVSANLRSNTASIIDLQSRVEVARIRVGNGPEYVLIDRSGRRAYVFCRLTNTISVIDLATRAVTGTLQTESGPVFGQLDSRGERLYVYHELSPNILAIPLGGAGTTRRILTGNGVRALKVNPLGDQLYVGSNFGGTIDIYDPFTLTGIDFLQAEGGASYLTIDSEENNLLALHPRRRQLRFVNLISKKERGLLDTGLDPYCVTVFSER